MKSGYSKNFGDYETSELIAMQKLIDSEVIIRHEKAAKEVENRLIAHRLMAEEYALKNFPVSVEERSEIINLGLRDQVTWFKDRFDCPSFEEKHKKCAFSMTATWVNALVGSQFIGLTIPEEPVEIELF